MIREQTIRARQKLVSKLPISGELLRGTLLERTVRHTKDCPKCARGEGHQVFVLTVTYPGHRTRQFSVRRERVAEVRHVSTVAVFRPGRPSYKSNFYCHPGRAGGTPMLLGGGDGYIVPCDFPDPLPRTRFARFLDAFFP